MISAEQIAAIDRAVARVVRDHDGARLHVDLEGIDIELEDGERLYYDIEHEAYATAMCNACGAVVVCPECGG